MYQHTVPHNEGIEACKEVINSRTYQSLPNEDLCNLMQLMLTKNMFTFNGSFYLELQYMKQPWAHKWHRSMQTCSWGSLNMSCCEPRQCCLCKVWWRFTTTWLPYGLIFLANNCFRHVFWELNPQLVYWGSYIPSYHCLQKNNNCVGDRSLHQAYW